MMGLKGALALILAALAAACAATYQEAASSAPHATLTFAKGYETGVRPGGAAANVYWIAADDACANMRRAAFISYDSAPEQSRRVPAGAVAHLVAETQSFETVQGAGVDYATVETTTQCRAAARFTPLAGHTYRVVHTQERARSCQLSVVDAATAAAPPDLRVEERFFCPGDPEANRPQLLQ